jgi:uncharacterized protein with PIN domain/sulfur carrier protein ThiS
MRSLVNIRLYEELNDFLPETRRKIAFNIELKQSRSVKDLLESIGVPHTEIDLIIVNGESVGFDYQVQDADRISVYPMFRSLDISPLRHCQPPAHDTPRFILDVHLGRLAAYLRMLGFDTLYQNDYDDPILSRISMDEDRILLTCDRQLLMRSCVTHGYFVRSRVPRQQLAEIMSRFDLYDGQQPFRHCMKCNGKIEPVDKKRIESRLLAKTRKYYDEFFICINCNKIYWKGTHYQKMKKMIKEITT